MSYDPLKDLKRTDITSQSRNRKGLYFCNKAGKFCSNPLACLMCGKFRNSNVLTNSQMGEKNER